jgi:hypothetical protein
MSSDMSGYGSNLTFRNNLPPGAPYYYITAHLDLSGKTEGTYYFNKDNNYMYLNPVQTEEYHGFHTIDTNSVIGDVVLFSNPNLVCPEGKCIEIAVGGAADLLSDVDPIWGGVTGFTPGTVNIDDVNTGSICYFGYEGGNPLEATPNNTYLAVTLTECATPTTTPPILISNSSEPVIVNEENKEEATRVVGNKVLPNGVVFNGEHHIRQKRVVHEVPLPMKRGKRSMRALVVPAIESGTLYVVVKVYPKYQ